MQSDRQSNVAARLTLRRQFWRWRRWCAGSERGGRSVPLVNIPAAVCVSLVWYPTRELFARFGRSPYRELDLECVGRGCRLML